MALKTLLLVWFAMSAILLFGLATGKMLAHGSSDGGMGLGHFADRTQSPRVFWQYAALYSLICFYLFLGTDGFTLFEGISRLVGRDTPIS